MRWPAATGSAASAVTAAKDSPSSERSSSSGPRSRATPITRAPALLRATAIPRPSPRLAPVTSAVTPDICPSVMVILCKSPDFGPPSAGGLLGRPAGLAAFAAAAGYSRGRPNEAARPGSRKLTIRAIPVLVTDSTVSPCKWYAPSAPRPYTANAGCPLAAVGVSRKPPGAANGEIAPKNWTTAARPANQVFIGGISSTASCRSSSASRRASAFSNADENRSSTARSSGSVGSASSSSAGIDCAS